MTYKDIQDIYMERTHKGISTCAIADARRKLGYPVKVSKGRIDKDKIQKSATDQEVNEVDKILKGK